MFETPAYLHDAPFPLEEGGSANGVLSTDKCPEPLGDAT